MIDKEAGAMGGTRVTKKQFLAAAARRADMSVSEMQSAYTAMFEELLATVTRGEDLTLTGFGRFYMRTHAGHSVQFATTDEGGPVVIEPYQVLKFSASRDLNKSLQVATD